MTTRPLSVRRTLIEFAVRFVTLRFPSWIVSLAFTRMSAPFLFAIKSGTHSSE